MLYQLRGDWPVSQFCIPAGTVINSAGTDQWSMLVKHLRPPLNVMPLMYPKLKTDAERRLQEKRSQQKE
jgi:hypothetical protein